MCRKFFIRIIIFALASVLTISPCAVYAMNGEFVEHTERWYDEKYNISSGMLSGAEGFYQYYFDIPNNTVSFHISYSYDMLKEGSEVKAGASISNSENEYDFTFDESIAGGDTDSFNILSSFSEIRYGGQEIFFALEFLNKEDRKLTNNLSVYLVIDNSAVPVCNDISLQFEPEKETHQSKATTEKKSSTAAKANKPDSKKSSNTTKFRNNTNGKYSFKPDKTTKFNYSINSGNSNESAEFGEGTVETESSVKSTFSLESKICFAIALIFAAAGIILLLSGLSNRSLDSENQQP